MSDIQHCDVCKKPIRDDHSSVRIYNQPTTKGFPVPDCADICVDCLKAHRVLRTALAPLFSEVAVLEQDMMRRGQP
jgi:hypothetical protein